MAEAEEAVELAVNQEEEKEEPIVEEEKANQEDSDSDADEPPPGEGLSEEVFEVEKILEHIYEDDGLLYFRVRWRNYTEEDDSWEPADNLGSAATAIQAYWDSDLSKKNTKEKKSKSKKRSSGGSSKKAKTPKEPKPPKEKKTPARRSAPSPDLKEDDEEEEPPVVGDSGSDDDDYAEEGKKKNKTVTKASVKAYDTPRGKRGVASSSGAPEISSARKAAMKHRSSWLYDDDSDDEDEPKKKKAPVPEAVEEPQAEEPEEQEEPVEKVKPEVEKVIEKEPEPVPSTSTRRCPTLKIKLEKPKPAPKADIYSPKLLNMENAVGELSIEGLVLNKNKSWQVLVKDEEGRSGILSAETAYEKIGRDLLQYMLDRAVFQR